jgi:hypothetical protein
MASASGFEAIFVSKLLFIRAICGFNSGFLAESISAMSPAEKR